MTGLYFAVNEESDPFFEKVDTLGKYGIYYAWIYVIAADTRAKAEKALGCITARHLDDYRDCDAPIECPYVRLSGGFAYDLIWVLGYDDDCYRAEYLENRPFLDDTFDVWPVEEDDLEIYPWMKAVKQELLLLKLSTDGTDFYRTDPYSQVKFYNYPKPPALL